MGAIPRHVALIMDGNGRWAKKRLMPRSFGHGKGMNRLTSLVERAKECGIEYLTVFALSSENLSSRPQEELDGLFDLIRDYFGKKIIELHKKGARVKVIGDLSPLPADVRQLLLNGEKNSPENATFTLTFAVNYGSRAEIVRAVNIAVGEGKKVDEGSFASLLYTAGMPDPDLVIRTGGEKRLSNFLLYQASYAELYFTDVLFPDFTPRQLDKAIADFGSRGRRFGGVDNK